MEKTKAYRAKIEECARKFAADYDANGLPVAWSEYETVCEFLYQLNEYDGEPLYFDRACGIRDDWSSTIMITTFVRGIAGLGKSVIIEWDAPLVGFANLSDLLDLIAEYADEAFDIQSRFRAAA